MSLHVDARFTKEEIARLIHIIDRANDTDCHAAMDSVMVLYRMAHMYNSDLEAIYDSVAHILCDGPAAAQETLKRIRDAHSCGIVNRNPEICNKISGLINRIDENLKLKNRLLELLGDDAFDYL